MAFYGGSFLIARPTLRDPNFYQTVILLVQHDAEGAFGLVLNRPLPAPKDQDLPFKLYSGGPCESEGLFMVHGHEDWAKENAGEEPVNVIAPGIYLGDSSLAAKLNHLNKVVYDRVRLFAGYAGWGPGQLERELEEGAWSISAADSRILFKTPPRELWSHLRPPSIPQPSVN